MRTPTRIDDLANQDQYGVETFYATTLETVDDAERSTMVGPDASCGSAASIVAPRISGLRARRRPPRCHRPAPHSVDRSCRPSTSAATSPTTAGPCSPAQSILTGIEHTINGGAWTARLSLDDAAPSPRRATPPTTPPTTTPTVYARTG